MDKNEDINIVFSSDNNYSKYTGIAICSIFENKTTNKNINIFILDGGISETNKDKLNYLSSKYNFTLTFKNIKNKEIKKLKTRGHITHPAYYRMIIPEILSGLNKVLYLDCDILVMKDLDNLYSINIDNTFIAACDEREYSKGSFEKLGIPEGSKYFNSGVMLINIKKWKEENYSEKLLKHAIKNSYNFDMHDQDVLNSLMYDKWIEISPKYNYISNFVDINLIEKRQISIVHFTGEKPWNYDCLNPFRKEYIKYLNLTPWKNETFYVDKNFQKYFIKILKQLSIIILPKKILINLRKIRYAKYLKKIKNEKTKI